MIRHININIHVNATINSTIIQCPLLDLFVCVFYSLLSCIYLTIHLSCPQSPSSCSRSATGPCCQDSSLPGCYSCPKFKQSPAEAKPAFELAHWHQDRPQEGWSLKVPGFLWLAASSQRTLKTRGIATSDLISFSCDDHLPRFCHYQ